MKELFYVENRGEFMTIDEAIVHAREVASEERMRSGICVQNDSECDKFSTCLKCAEEHEQLAEWLEELKYYKNDYGDIVSKIATFEADKLKIYNCGYILGYIKGINDLIAKCKNAKFTESDEISLSDIHTGVNSGLSMAIHFAEQLKAGVTND